MENISGIAAKEIIKGSLLKEKVDEQVSEYVAQGLVSTSLRGTDSHGIRLIHHYLAGIKSGRINPCPSYFVEKRMPTIAVLDADHTFGHAAGMEAAKKRGRRIGRPKTMLPRAEVLALRDRGLSTAEIARRLNVSRPTLCRELRALGL